LPKLDINFFNKHINSDYQTLSIDIIKKFNIDISNEDLIDVLKLYKNFDNEESPVDIKEIKSDLFSCELFH
jgi:threonine synthase